MFVLCKFLSIRLSDINFVVLTNIIIEGVYLEQRRFTFKMIYKIKYAKNTPERKHEIYM